MPLCYWNYISISQIASKNRILLTFDNIMAFKSKLTFAWVYIYIHKISMLLDMIKIKIKGKEISLNVIYDWKPNICNNCGSFSHSSTFYPKNPICACLISQSRSRSISSNRRRFKKIPSFKPPLIIILLNTTLVIMLKSF